MVSYALKGAVIDYPQLEGRARFLAGEGLPLCLELHTFGARDLHHPAGRAESLANVVRLREEFGPAELTVHIPFQIIGTVTSRNFDDDQVADTLAFAEECGARRIVMHRYWGMNYGNRPPRSDRETATAGFSEAVRALARQAPDIALFVENIGHYFLASGKPEEFIAGPLDHFFPWEIDAFRADMASHDVGNVFPFVDVAHATLSSNLFNHTRRHRKRTKDDPRYSAILDSDLDRTGRLHPFDFVDGAMPWLHVSDSFIIDEPLPPDLPRAGLTSEGLELGTGTLPFEDLPARLGGATANTVLLLEVEPGKHDNYVQNAAQCRSLDYLRRRFPE